MVDNQHKVKYNRGKLASTTGKSVVKIQQNKFQKWLTTSLNNCIINT